MSTQVLGISHEVLIVLSCFLMSFSIINLRYWVCFWWTRQRIRAVFAAVLVHFNGIAIGAGITAMVFNGAPSHVMAWIISVFVFLLIVVEWISIETSIQWTIQEKHDAKRAT